VLLTAALVAYSAIGASWTTFALLLLLPDLSLIGYAAGPRAGAYAYNASHTYAAPALLGVLVHLGVLPGAWGWSLIWLAHIGLDRSLGLGLKFATSFHATHLGPIGRAERQAA
jgi:hypothetical protein